MRLNSLIAAFVLATVAYGDVTPSKSGVVEPTSILTRNLRGEVHEAFNRRPRPVFGTVSSNDESTSADAPAAANGYQTPTRKRKIDEAELLLNFATSNNGATVGRQQRKSVPPLDNRIRSDEIDTKQLINLGKLHQKWREEVYQESTELKNAPEPVKQMAQAKEFFKYYQNHPSSDEIDKKQIKNLGKHYKKWREEVYQEPTDLKDAPAIVRQKAKAKKFLEYIKTHLSNTNQHYQSDQTTAIVHGHKSNIAGADTMNKRKQLLNL
jgi:hypothetical protein